MPAPRKLLFALILPAALMTAQAEVPSPQAIAESCAAGRTEPAATRPASGVYILDRFETLDDLTGQPVASPLAPEDALDPAALGQAALSTLGHTIARDIEAELEAASRLSWIELDADTRTATVVGTSRTAPRRARFTPDFSCLLPEEGDTPPMPVDALDVGRFAMQIRAFGTHRLTWRRVETDSAALAEIRRMRDEAEATVR
ncbi:hypothetical protein [Luteimonas sp. 3794]|uniref:hypothetical protein n=1 Tax=Luteimonas sp. 3794 TaxID=2817730 RepID=UPI0028639F1D|nr:hypothetical protein [Luteimonas sp. 3794]MDR6990690.1 hypothetical protein [Luteimonas sp. 3794]